MVPEAAREPANRPVAPLPHHVRFLAFTFAHVTMVVLTGFGRNMNHIVMGTDDARPIGLYLGLAGIAVVVVLNALANWAAWRRPRAVQHAAKGDRHAGHAALPRPRRPGGGVPPRGHLALLLAERQGAYLRRVEGAGRQRPQGLPVAGVRPG